MLKFIDISYGQGVFDFSIPRTKGIVGIISKASEAYKNYCGCFTDTQFPRNWQLSKEYGYIRGAYHFFRNKQSPEMQADYFYNLIKDDLGDIPPVLDIEDRAYIPSDVNIRIKKFLDRLTILTGRDRFIIYTGPDYWKSYVKNSSDFMNHYLWIANYKASAPLTPLPWFPGEEILWQFNDKGDGKFYGAESYGLDMNKSNLTRQEMLSL